MQQHAAVVDRAHALGAEPALHDRPLRRSLGAVEHRDGRHFEMRQHVHPRVENVGDGSLQPPCVDLVAHAAGILGRRATRSKSAGPPLRLRCGRTVRTGQRTRCRTAEAVAPWTRSPIRPVAVRAGHQQVGARLVHEPRQLGGGIAVARAARSARDARARGTARRGLERREILAASPGPRSRVRGSGSAALSTTCSEHQLGVAAIARAVGTCSSTARVRGTQLERHRDAAVERRLGRRAPARRRRSPAGHDVGSGAPARPARGIQRRARQRREHRRQR